MELEVLFTRDENVYIVKYNGVHYLVNLETNKKPAMSQEIYTFLRFGYFDYVESISEDTVKQLKARIDEYYK